MPSANLPQRLDEISKKLESLCAQSLSHPDKAAETLQDGLGQFQVILKELTTLAGGGMTEAERDAFVEDKLACEHEKSLARQEKLLDATRKVLAQKDLIGLLQTAADSARELTGAKYAATGHGYVNGVFTAGGASHSEGAMPCPPGEAFNVEKGGVYFDLVKEKDSIRFTDAEMRSHPAWWGLPEGHVPLRGLLGARLVDVNGQPNGLLMVGDKEDGTDFTTEDENTLSQLAAIVSLALQHIEARLEAENKERRLEALMKALPVGVSFSDDPICQSITGNPAALAQFEVEPEDNLSASAPNGNAPGRQVRYFMDGQQISDAELPLQRAVAENREIPPMELEAELPSGRRWFTEASGAPIIDAQGNVIGGVAVTVDITERKLAEEALRDSERRRADILNSITSGYQVLDRDGRYVDFNAAARRMLAASGVDADSLIGRNVFEVFPGSSDLAGGRAVSRTLAERVPSAAENYFEPWGAWFHVHNYPTADGGVAMFFEDITERKRAEEALRKSEERLRLAQQAARVGTFEWNLQTDRDVWTSELEDIYGLRPGEFAQTGTAWAQLIHPEDRANVMQVSQQSIQTGELTTGEWRVVWPDGSVHWLAGRWQVFKDASGQPLRMIGVNMDITDRKQAEEALRQSEERFRIAVMNSSLSFAQVDRDLRFTWIYNPHTDFKSHTGKRSDEVVDCDGTRRMTAIRRQVLETGKGVRAEISFNFSDGVHVYDTISDPIYDGEGAMIGVATASLDITERKRAEEKLWESERKFFLMFQKAPFCAVLLRISDMVYVDVNEEFTKVFGFSKEEAIGKTAIELGINPDVDARMHIKSESLEKRFVSGIEQRLYTKSGEQRVFQTSVRVLEFGGDEYFLATLADITERKKSEEALKETEERLRLSLDAAQFGTFDYNPATGQTIWDDQMKKIWGIAKEENLDYSSVLARVHPEDQERVSQTFAKALSPDGNGFYEAQYRIIWPDGSIHWTYARGKVYSQGEGDNRKVTRVVGIEQDITERKRAEEALQKAHDELEQRVLERTADLARTNEELLKAKDAAEEAVRAKAAFLANMSHELRTPMNSIMGFTSLLLEEPLPVEYKDWLDTMKINGEALLALINDVLDFSKMEKDKIELEIHPFNLRQRIEESLDLVSTKAAEKGLDLAYLMDSNVPETIISDSARLRQVLANLLSNAVKFTDTGDVLVHVTSKQDGDLHEIHFAVQDTGIGMPQSQMSKLFQPFSQINTAPSRLTEGTGLGLAISKKLVELMGGKIWAESEEGKGSTFIFTIKAKAALDDMAIKLPVGPQPQLAKRNVLIVEDNQTMRRLLGHQTKSWGMVPLVVSLSYSANELIQNGVTPDVAIIDASMPDLDGIVLAQMIRRHRRDLPLIIMTSPGQHIPQNLLAVNLPKPIKPLQLYDALTNLLEGRPIQEQYQAPEADQTSVSPIRILLAEDNISSQQIAMGMLKKLGYKADVAANGVEVVQALERQHYDVVLMDIKMPEMDGYEAARAIRQRWPDNGPKIIAITAYALEGDREKCLEAGMDDYISKPVQKEDLARALKDIERL